MDWDTFELFDEGFLIVDEEEDEQRISRPDEDTFTMNPDEGFENKEAQNDDEKHWQ